MKAAVVTDFSKTLTIGEVAKPVPAPGEVLVKVETSGLCHTDIHAAHGDWPVRPSLPLIPGHEGVGIVEEVGDGVTLVQVGDRVAMPWLGSACGVCQFCVDGWETLCEQQVNTGYGRDGGYAEYATADAAHNQTRTRYLVREGELAHLSTVSPLRARRIGCARDVALPLSASSELRRRTEHSDHVR